MQVSEYEQEMIVKLIAAETFNNPTLNDERHVMQQMEGRRVIKIPDYVSDSPKWCGDLFVIIWGDPHLITYIGHYQSNGNTSKWEVFFHGDVQFNRPLQGVV